MDSAQIILLALVSFFSWFFSILLGGGCPLLLIPVISLFLGLEAVAPVLTLGLLMGNAQRLFLFKQDVDFSSSRWFLPGSIVGALIGAWLLKFIHLEGLQFVLGGMMLCLALYCGVRKTKTSWTFQSWHFLPIAFVNAIGSSLVGSTGSLMNPMYLNYGLQKESFIATKSLHTSGLHLVKVLSYLAFGSFHPDYFVYGGVIGLASFPANWLGKFCLARMTAGAFAQAVLVLMAVSGTWMLWEQRSWMIALTHGGAA